MSFRTIDTTLLILYYARTHNAGDNGSMTWWDYKTGLPFQTSQDIAQPGSLEAESGIFASTFDQTGSRLILGCADKTIKIYSEQT